MSAGSTSAPPTPLLVVRNLSKSFRGLRALNEHELTAHAGDLLGVIGPNGSGKTTLFNLISGFTRPDEGSVALEGHELTRLRPPHIARLGVARSFQGSRLCASLSVLENVAAAAQRRHPVSSWGATVRAPAYRRDRSHGRPGSIRAAFVTQEAA